MRALIALVAVLFLVGCASQQPAPDTPKTPAANIVYPEPPPCSDVNVNGVCDEHETGPIVAPAKAAPPPVVETPSVAPAPKVSRNSTANATPVPTKPARKPIPKPSSAGYLDGFGASPSRIILDGEKNKGGAVAAASDIIAYLKFPQSLSVEGIDTFSKTLDDYSAYNLIVLGNACANGFTAQLYGTPAADCATQFANQTGEIRQFTSNGHSVLVVAGSDDTVVRNIVKLLVAGAIPNTGDTKQIRLADY